MNMPRLVCTHIHTGSMLRCPFSLNTFGGKGGPVRCPSPRLIGLGKRAASRDNITVFPPAVHLFAVTLKRVLLTPWLLF